MVVRVLHLYRPWQRTPCIPFAASRFDISTHGSDLTVVSHPDLRRTVMLALCACVAIVALMYPVFEYHPTLVALALIGVYFVGIQAQAVLTCLMVRQEVRVSPGGW